MKRIINGKTYNFMFIILPSGNQGLIYKIEGELNPKIYQVNNHHGGDMELVEFEILRSIKKGEGPRGTDEKEWSKMV